MGCLGWGVGGGVGWGGVGWGGVGGGGWGGGTGKKRMEEQKVCMWDSNLRREASCALQRAPASSSGWYARHNPPAPSSRPASSPRSVSSAAAQVTAAWATKKPSEM